MREVFNNLNDKTYDRKHFHGELSNPCQTDGFLVEIVSIYT